MHPVYFTDVVRQFIGMKIPLGRYSFYKELGGHKLIFIHPPKTAGTSIAKAFRFPPPNPKYGIEKHNTAHEIKGIVGEAVWNDSFKFAFVRNPWSRLYSQYRYRINAGHIKPYRKDMEFNIWCQSVLSQRKLRNFKPQVEWLGMRERDLELDFVGRFENLESDLGRMSDLLDEDIEMPHLLAGGYSDNYQDVYDSSTIELVREVYREDIDNLGYDFAN
jgi:hypothetical protein